MTSIARSPWLRLWPGMGWSWPTQPVARAAPTVVPTRAEGVRPGDRAETVAASDDEAYWMAVMKYCGCCC
jgi:hypothetical protein